MHVLAVDLGTTWCKAAFVDQAGRFLAEGRAYSRFGAGHGPGAPELDRLWQAVVTAVRAANDDAQALGIDPAPVAIGCAARGGNTVWLDGQGAPVTPGEPVEAGAEIEELTAAPVWGTRGVWGYGYAPAIIGRALWMHRRKPALWQRVTRAGVLHDWLLWRLTGCWLTDAASGPSRDAWPPAALALIDKPDGAFPAVAPAERIAGGLLPQAARDLGLPDGIPVVTGCHDGVAANLGAGAIDPGDACITLGSNLVLRAVTGERLPGCFGYPISRDRWAWVRGAHGIAARLDAVVDLLDGGGLPVAPGRHQRLTALAEPVAPGAGGLRLEMLPRGIETEPAARALAARQAGATDGVVYRAALEGAVRGIHALVERARREDAPLDRFVLTGGATANLLLVRILSALLQAPLEVAAAEAGLRGAALLAATGAGWYPDLPAAVAAIVPPGQTIVADDAETAAYAGKRRVG